MNQDPLRDSDVFILSGLTYAPTVNPDVMIGEFVMNAGNWPWLYISFDLVFSVDLEKWWECTRPVFTLWYYFRPIWVLVPTPGRLGFDDVIITLKKMETQCVCLVCPCFSSPPLPNLAWRIPAYTRNGEMKVCLIKTMLYYWLRDCTVALWHKTISMIHIYNYDTNIKYYTVIIIS